MGADRLARATYRCFHDCRIEGCPGHTVDVWYREGRYYFSTDEWPYREAPSLDSNLMEAVLAALGATDYA